MKQIRSQDKKIMPQIGKLEIGDALKQEIVHCMKS